MKTLLAALIAGAIAVSSGPAIAQQKKSEPTKEELKKTEAKKAEKSDKAEAKKDEGKKKVKKGGC